MKPTIVFDLNETLLDMSALDATFGRIFGQPRSAEFRAEWFGKLVELFLTVTVIGQYRPFDELTDEALHVIAAQHGASVSKEQAVSLKKALGRMPAHPDVHPGLEQLRHAGFTLVVLTNSRAHAATNMIEHAGLRMFFEQVLSADDVRRYKPAREAYAYAAQQLGVGVHEIVLVATHAWDIAGALAAGCKAAFLARPEKVLGPGTPRTQLQARNLRDLAALLVARYS